MVSETSAVFKCPEGQWSVVSGQLSGTIRLRFALTADN
jgi:hypothetical protein